MGKGGGSEPAQTQFVQAPTPNIPNQDNLMAAAMWRTMAASPWTSSPWRSMDFLFGAPSSSLQVPQFQPNPGQAQFNSSLNGDGGSGYGSGTPMGQSQIGSGLLWPMYFPQALDWSPGGLLSSIGGGQPGPTQGIPPSPMQGTGGPPQGGTTSGGKSGYQQPAQQQRTDKNKKQAQQNTQPATPPQPVQAMPQVDPAQVQYSPEWYQAKYGAPHPNPEALAVAQQMQQQMTRTGIPAPLAPAGMQPPPWQQAQMQAQQQQQMLQQQQQMKGWG